jgi:hypothetical protein
VDLELAAVAGAGVDLADRDRPAEQLARLDFQRAAELGQERIVAGLRRRRVPGRGAGMVSGLGIR